jgi:bacillolysin
VGNGVDVREFVFVDAHSGKVIEQFTGMHDGLNRRAFDSLGQNQPGPNYPNNPFWVEGMAFPTASAEANNMLSASAEIHDLFIKAFGRDSFDGNGATMDSIFNRGNGCPNASWNGIYISFCPGTTTDDITAHEWGHAYTEYTHGLIYAWQPGALNEAYSDIWGETVDRINGRGGDTPDQARTAGACTASTPLEPTLTVNAPGSIAGSLPAGGASFGLQSFSLTSDLVQVKSGGAQSVGCTVADFTASGVAGQGGLRRPRCLRLCRQGRQRLGSRCHRPGDRQQPGRHRRDQHVGRDDPARHPGAVDQPDRWHRRQGPFCSQ